MATATTNTVIDHTSDAGFRAWVAEFITLLVTGGALVQTADTGQINTATVTRPGPSTNGGYAIFRFNDSLQSTAPYFFRFDFGTYSFAVFPRIQLTIGTGSNGSGTITGSILSATTISRETALTSTVIAYPSWACGHNGTISVAFKSGANASGFCFVGLHRIRDWAGDQTADGLVLYYTLPNGQWLNQQSFRRVNPISFGPSNAYALVPHFTTTSVQPGGAPLYYSHYTAIPEVRPVLEAVTVISSEIGEGSTTTARPFGSTDRTYLALGSTMIRAAAAGVGGGSQNHTIAMLYD